MNFLLVHSPVVGPSTWRWVAEALRKAGHKALLPDLVAAALSGDPEVFAGAAAGGEPDQPIVLVGHSGAGVLLPVIAAALPTWPSLTVFVDATIPPCEGRSTVAGDFVAVLQELSANGIVRKWSQWWDEGVLEAIVPEDERRQEIESELPEVPLRFFETPIEVPARWCERPAAYLLLSDGYRGEADRASTLGWPVRERPGDHLDIVNAGAAIADLLLDLVEGRDSSPAHAPEL